MNFFAKLYFHKQNHKDMIVVKNTHVVIALITVNFGSLKEN